MVVMGSPILTTTHGGYTLLLANNPVVYRQEVDKPWGTTWDDAPPGERQSDWLAGVLDDMHRELGPQPNEVAADRWMSARAWKHIRDEPATFVRSIGFRLRLLWNVAPLAPARAGLPRLIVWGVSAFYSLVFVAALAGLLALGHWQRHSPAPWSPLLLLLVTVTLAHAIYWSNARMRAPLMPAVAVLAAAAVPGLRRIGP
jgi:hypothetical protein